MRLLRALQHPFRGYGLYGRRFDREDVNAWVGDVQHTLRDRPAELQLFNWEPPMDTATNLLAAFTEEQSIRRMQRRLRQLDKVIERL